MSSQDNFVGDEKKPPSTLSPNGASQGILNPGRLERKGERRQRRYEATKLRRIKQAEEAARNVQRPGSAKEAAARWDAFYLTKASLYKDRHLLRSQLVDAVSPNVAADTSIHVPPLNFQPDSNLYIQDILLVEAGCGAGAAVYPLLRANPRLHAIAFDLSSKAIQALQRSPEYSSRRVTAFVADISQSDSYLPAIYSVRPCGAHFVTAVWTLSALPNGARVRAAHGLASALGPGGTLYIRDYAHGDLREHRFLAAGRRVQQNVDCDVLSCCDQDDKISEADNASRLFLRGDGTYAYFFTVEEIQALFTQQGLSCISCAYEERVVHNRKLGTSMCRRWVVARFQKPAKLDSSDASLVNERSSLSIDAVLSGVLGEKSE